MSVMSSAGYRGGWRGAWESCLEPGEIPQGISVSKVSDIPVWVTQGPELRGSPAGMVARGQLKCFLYSIGNVCLEYLVDKAQKDAQLVMSALGREMAEGELFMPQKEVEQEVSGDGRDGWGLI